MIEISVNERCTYVSSSSMAGGKVIVQAVAEESGWMMKTGHSSWRPVVALQLSTASCKTD